jgi:predicted transcriptional regulator
MMPEISEIKRRRKRVGITQKELAAMSGVSQSLIAKIESGSVKPTYQNVKRIIETLESAEKKEKTKVKEIMSRKIVSIKKSDRMRKAIDLMRKSDYSQLPVLEGGHPIGTISDKTVVDIVSTGRDLSEIIEERVSAFMDEALPTVQENESIDVISAILQTNQAVLVVKRGNAVGIVTKADLFKIASQR